MRGMGEFTVAELLLTVVYGCSPKEPNEEAARTMGGSSSRVRGFQRE